MNIIKTQTTQQKLKERGRNRTSSAIAATGKQSLSRQQQREDASSDVGGRAASSSGVVSWARSKARSNESPTHHAERSETGGTVKFILLPLNPFPCTTAEVIIYYVNRRRRRRSARARSSIPLLRFFMYGGKR